MKTKIKKHWQEGIDANGYQVMLLIEETEGFYPLRFSDGEYVIPQPYGEGWFLYTQYDNEVLFYTWRRILKEV